MGGAGSAVAEALAAQGIEMPLLQLGFADTFPDRGDPAQLLADCGLDAAGSCRPSTLVSGTAGRKRLQSRQRRPAAVRLQFES
jgi:hypothetical protein